MPPLFAIFDIPFTTMLIFGVLAVLLFGERLPEVARSVGKGFMEFKRHMNGIQDEIRNAIDTAAAPPSTPSSASPYSALPQSDESEVHEEATAPKFEPPAS
jgi:sec-independent protein translocase protein TatA